MYCYFQGLCWRLAYAMLGEHISLPQFAKRFFRVNVQWYILFILMNIMLFIAAYISASITKNADGALNPLWYIPYLLLLYLMLASYSRLKEARIGIKATVALAWKRRLLLVYLVILMLYAAIHYLLIGASYMGRPAVIIGGLLLFIPSFTAARLYWLVSSR